jgi:uncharacterized paraquat-inducible protein A
VICTMLAAMSFDSRLIWYKPNTQPNIMKNGKKSI